MTIQEALTQARSRLREIYEQGEADAIGEWLMEWITGAGRQLRFARPEQLLSATQEEQWTEAMDRLEKQEPIQYVTHQAWFCGLPLYVNEHVLIPRPETEELVEWVISHCRFPIQQLDILDVGTGSGCIALGLKKRLGKASIVACDISSEALEVARLNAEKLQLPIEFRKIDFLDPKDRDTLPQFEIIVSNPPYIPISNSQQLEKNVVNFEPWQALFVPDEKPLIFYEALAAFGHTHLRPSGSILVELQADLALACLDLFVGKGYQAELKQDFQGKWRMLRAWKS